MVVLVLNAGSSSLKYQVIAGDERIEGGTVQGVQEALAALKTEIHAVGHRIVHGGDRFSESVLITDEVLEDIRSCSELAPLHTPRNIEGILACRKAFGQDLPQVAVFDTAFHGGMPECAYLYAVPYDWYRKYRVRRYGFHGTSYRYVCERYGQIEGVALEKVNVIVLHLGNGCSVAAIKGGRSIDTSMGMTPLEGLVMGTRSGDLDPGIMSFIAEKEKLSLSEIEELLNKKSGLLGLSEQSNDMRELDHESRAVEVFCYRARKYIGAHLASMGGADAVIFTAGVGEHAPDVRARICAGLEWAGLKIDVEKNSAANGKEGIISTEDSRLAAYCIPTDEELMIARDTMRIVEVG